MAIDYMWEVFLKAVDALATGALPIQRRLQVAFEIMCGRIQPEKDLPPELAERAKEILYEGTCKPAKGDEGTIQATCLTMDDHQASRLAEKILGMFNDVCRLDAVEEYKRSKKKQ